MSLAAFIDESHDEKHYVLAGFGSTVEKWAQFSIAWDGVLKTPPQIHYFKNNHYYSPHRPGKSKRGEFSKLSQKERDDKVFALVRVINQYTDWDFTCSVNIRDFNRLLAPTVKPEARDPYVWLFQGIVTGMSSLEFHRGASRTIDFTFDEQKEFLGESLKLFNIATAMTPLLRERLDKIVGRILSGNDKGVLPLQAADMLAGQIRAVI